MAEVIIPSTITVHLGRPKSEAQNVTVPFVDYIKNVASSEIYPTWPESALRANIYAQTTFALNRIFTEWYRSQGYPFDITNSTQCDQSFQYGRDIFDSVDRIVDELFNDYIRREGSLAPLSKMPSVAVVGPRRPSEYGRKVCDALCTDMAKDGVALISGLAVGIDACVHRCAVNNGGYTVGVLGCGIMVNYPAENEELKEEIIKSGGAVISELLPYASVSASYFKQRNRIISGLAMGTLVPEASSRSGSLLTAAHAAMQGRRLMCIPPHDIMSERFSGTAQLMRDGARAVFSIRDIYSELNNGVQQCEQLDLLRQKAAEKLTAPKKQKSTKKTGALSKKPEEKKTQELDAPARVLPDIAQLGPQESEVVLLLKDGPLTMDELIDKTGKRYDEICSVILGLELMDAVVRSRDGMISLP